MTDTSARTAVDAAGDHESSEHRRPKRPGSRRWSRRSARRPPTTRTGILRTLAEMENMRRRTEREVADSRVYGITQLRPRHPGVADNMARGASALAAELREHADDGLKALLDGVELTERELHKVLEKHGVKKFEPLGEKFDPNLHQAMFEMPDPSRPSGTVAQVMQPGYMIGERVLRPALVGVAKGGPKAAPQPPANDNPRTARPVRRLRRAGRAASYCGDRLRRSGAEGRDETQHRALPHHPYRQPAAAGRSHPHDVRQGGGRAGRSRGARRARARGGGRGGAQAGRRPASTSSTTAKCRSRATPPT